MLSTYATLLNCRMRLWRTTQTVQFQTRTKSRRPQEPVAETLDGILGASEEVTEEPKRGYQPGVGVDEIRF